LKASIHRPLDCASHGTHLSNWRRTERLKRTFGPGALERTRSGCLGICPRLKMALAYAIDHAADRPLTDEHVLLGLLDVPDSVAARVLGGLGVSLQAAEAIVRRNAA
jgi:Clp amino terminal domain, pathogenicity island component